MKIIERTPDFVILEITHKLVAIFLKGVKSYFLIPTIRFENNHIAVRVTLVFLSFSIDFYYYKKIL